MAKKETFYAAFKFDFADFIHKMTPPHVGEDNMVLAFRDEIRAHDLWDKLKETQGKQLSIFGCGPESDQHVYLPTCTGLVKFEAPRDIMEGDSQVIDLSKHPEWIRQVDLLVSGDVSHGPAQFTQLTMMGEPEYKDFRHLMHRRMRDLETIATRIAAAKPEELLRTDLHDEFARDSLHAMYNSNGLTYTRRLWNARMTDDQRAMSAGLEYLQPYLHSMDANLGFDSILRHAHTLEQEFRDTFPEYYKNAVDERVAAAAAVAKIMGDRAEKSNDIHERTVFLSLQQNAKNDMVMYSELNDEYAEWAVATGEGVELKPGQAMDEPDERY